MTLTPSSAPAGRVATAGGSIVEECNPADENHTVTWQRAGASAASGQWVGPRLTVPEQLEPGTYTVEARCADNDDVVSEAASASFEVLDVTRRGSPCGGTRRAK